MRASPAATPEDVRSASRLTKGDRQFDVYAAAVLGWRCPGRGTGSASSWTLGGHGICPVVATSGIGSAGQLRHLRAGCELCEVVDGDGLVAVRAGAAAADAAAEQLAVRAALLVEEALLAVGALVDDVELLVVVVAAAGAGHRLPSRAMTPCPARAWLSRTLSPLVW